MALISSSGIERSESIRYLEVLDNDSKGQKKDIVDRFDWAKFLTDQKEPMVRLRIPEDDNDQSLVQNLESTGLASGLSNKEFWDDSPPQPALALNAAQVSPPRPKYIRQSQPFTSGFGFNTISRPSEQQSLPPTSTLKRSATVQVDVHGRLEAQEKKLKAEREKKNTRATEGGETRRKRDKLSGIHRKIRGGHKDDRLTKHTPKVRPGAEKWREALRALREDTIPRANQNPKRQSESSLEASLQPTPGSANLDNNLEVGLEQGEVAGENYSRTPSGESLVRGHGSVSNRSLSSHTRQSDLLLHRNSSHRLLSNPNGRLRMTTQSSQISMSQLELEMLQIERLRQSSLDSNTDQTRHVYDDEQLEKGFSLVSSDPENSTKTQMWDNRLVFHMRTISRCRCQFFWTKQNT